MLLRLTFNAYPAKKHVEGKKYNVTINSLTPIKFKSNTIITEK